MWRNMEFVNLETNKMLNEYNNSVDKNFDHKCEWTYVATVNEYIRN